MDWEKVFNVKTKNVSENLQVSVFEVKKLSLEIEKILDSKLVSICEGRNSTTNINIVKKRIEKLFKNKTDSWKMGAISEFFTHLYLSFNEYNQECLFFNLEEGSIKKGFDGFYSKDEKQWIMESKSGCITTRKITHRSKVNEALNDLEKMITGNEIENDPWRNAKICPYEGNMYILL